MTPVTAGRRTVYGFVLVLVAAGLLLWLSPHYVSGQVVAGSSADPIRCPSAFRMQLAQSDALGGDPSAWRECLVGASNRWLWGWMLLGMALVGWAATWFLFAPGDEIGEEASSARREQMDGHLGDEADHDAPMRPEDG